MRDDMQELSIERLKETELDIFIEIDRFCRKNEIQYSLAGGTLLGAVRHKGFIPWDDIDLMMTRENYDRFISLFSKEAGRYRVITYQNNPQYKYLFAKVVDSQTKVVEEHYFPVDDLGVFVDIFPIDALGNTIGEAKQKLKKAKFKRFLCNKSMLLKIDYCYVV
jgi:lipopolysaccharide cholinephosphotransferase